MEAGGGHKLLINFYKEYLLKVPELFLVGEDDENIIGFAMGYYSDFNEYQHLFLKHNFSKILLRCLLLAITFNKLFYHKVFQVLKSKMKKKTISKANKKSETYGDLLSICVLEEYRGSGASQTLMDSFLKVLKEKSIKTCMLSVKSDNGRAISFYKRNGFSIVQKSNNGITLSKNLSD